MEVASLGLILMALWEKKEQVFTSEYRLKIYDDKMTLTQMSSHL